MPEGGVCWKRGSTDLFFSDNTADQSLAKAMCFECPVQFECLEYAIENNEKFGIFGGLLPSERRIIVRLRKESVPGPAVADL